MTLEGGLTMETRTVRPCVRQGGWELVDETGQVFARVYQAFHDRADAIIRDHELAANWLALLHDMERNRDEWMIRATAAEQQLREAKAVIAEAEAKLALTILPGSVGDWNWAPWRKRARTLAASPAQPMEGTRE